MLLSPSATAKLGAFALTMAAIPALAETPAPAPQDPAQPEAITLETIEVISQELEAARLQIQPSLGASTLLFRLGGAGDNPARRKRAP
jgi:hypothetical protein